MKAATRARVIPDERFSAFRGLAPEHRVTNCGRCGALLVPEFQPVRPLPANRAGFPPPVAGYLPDPDCRGHEEPACEACLRVRRGRDIALRTDRRRAGVNPGDPDPAAENAVRAGEDA